MSTYAKKKVWVVNCYFDELRLPVARSLKLPQSMAPVYLAGAFNTDRCDVRLWNEQTAGPLQEKALLEGTDILVLSGMTNAFDRMLQLTACVKTLNPHAVVIAGGPAIRALPKLSAAFFDEICTGDAEQLRDVVRGAVGSEFVSERMTPRYELGDWVKNSRFGYAESTRNCNFRCSFCTMTAENRAYQKLSLDALREQILAQGKKDVLIFLDNNFYGNDRSHFTQRLELLKEMRAAGHFNGWAALVTNDFFAKDENLQLAKESGCVALFSGIESFDAAWLRSQGKKQNTVLPQLELIRRCHAHGIVFMYGLMLDVNTRPLQELRDEIEFILSRPEISLPSYLSIPIPILNTPIFHDAVRENKFLPHVKLRDMDSTTLTTQTRDPLDQCATFVRELQTLDGQWGSVLKHTLGFVRRHATQFSIKQHLIALSNPVMLTVGHALSTLSWKASSAPRTHIASTEKLDACYTPPFTIASEYEHYYRPTYVTDSRGALTVEMDELNRSVAAPKIAGVAA